MKILCKIGWHRWKFTDTTRKCSCCGKAQQIHKEAAQEWGVVIWIDE